MVCGHCGSQIPDNSRFCLNCGQPIGSPSASVVLTMLKCRSCGADIQTDPGQSSAACPYCGTNYTLVETEAVATERIRSESRRATEHEIIELERENRSAIAAAEAADRELERLQKYKEGIMLRLSILFGVFSILEAYLSFSNTKILSGIVAVSQIILFSLSIFIGTNVIKIKTRWLYIVFNIIGFIFVCLWMSTYNGRFADYVF